MLFGLQKASDSSLSLTLSYVTADIVWGGGVGGVVVVYVYAIIWLGVLLF